MTQITDLFEDGGALYCAGNWRNILRPTSTVGEFGTWTSNGNSRDMFVARIGTADLGWQKLIFLDSPVDDEINQLVTASDGIHVTGSSGKFSGQSRALATVGESRLNFFSNVDHRTIKFELLCPTTIQRPRPP